MTPRTLLHRAARVISQVAQDIRSSNTVNGKWPADHPGWRLFDAMAKREHDDLAELARELRRYAKTLPCPFCGASGSQCHADEVDSERWTVICELCGANGPINADSNTPGKALLYWECRAVTAPVSQADLDQSQALNEGDGSYRP